MIVCLNCIEILERIGRLGGSKRVRTCQEIPASRRSSFIILWPSVVKNLSLELQTHFPVSPIENQASKFIFHAFTHKY